ncbi:MAG: FAD-dependent thymidylate synthase [Gemmatimonadota bacterium]
MTERFLSAEPEVRLTKAFSTPFQNVIATARTCYSGGGIVPEETVDDRWRGLARSLYQAGHHTTIQHGQVQFAIANVSRHFLWSFLHSSTFYNSEQVSQRYVAVKPGTVAVPPLPPAAERVFRETVAGQMAGYRRLKERLAPAAAAAYFSRFPARRTHAARFRRDVQRKAQEVARYVLPVATFAYLYHTVSAITLLRYARLVNAFDTPLEQRIVIGKMVEALLEFDPEYRTILEEPLPLEELPEHAHFAARGAPDAAARRVRREAFDRSLEGRTSKLVDWKLNNEPLLAESVREVLGSPPGELTDEEAIELALSPARNRLLGEPLNLATHGKLTRTLYHPHYTFRKRLSHAADSQDQRHRTTPGSRPVLAAVLEDEPDYVTPTLLHEDAGCLADYRDTMTWTWERMRDFRCAGGSEEFAQYLLPNAVAIRFTESADLLNLYHKHNMRLCYNAQEEIWRASVDEAEQVREINPFIGRFLLPPCTTRMLAGARPYCPEGPRYCGERVWTYDLSQFQRVI